jgi:ribulose-5-phosphate 4-epimerase/fuculose-1-phosphate aldolase
METFRNESKDEGYIKFNCHWIKTDPIPSDRLCEINEWRDKLYHLGLIGVYDDGIGFGNISIRAENNTFIITGSGTGNLNQLSENHYVLVNDYDVAKNSLTCAGPIKASSESLSHAMVYECLPETNSVIHIHNTDMWEKLMDQIPTTDKNVTYGTPEMASEIKKIVEELGNKEKILVMGGHEGGIITFGKNLDEAGGILLRYFNQSQL